MALTVHIEICKYKADYNLPVHELHSKDFTLCIAKKASLHTGPAARNCLPSDVRDVGKITLSKLHHILT